MRRSYVRLLIVFLLPTGVFAQIGGLNSYQFLNLPSSSRVTALGGYYTGVADGDVMQGIQNPAVINSKMNRQLSIQHRFHLADISHSHVAYGLGIDSSHLLLINLQYLDYGDFVRVDEFGNRSENFSGGDGAITVGTSHRLDDRLSLGLNLKFVTSSLDIYNSVGLGADIGFFYNNPGKRSAWSLLLRNIGGQLNSYGTERSSFPLDFVIGYVKRLEHLPFRFSITGHDIQRWGLTYDSELNGDVTIINGAPNSDTSSGSIIENVFRHLAFGGELLLGAREGFILRFGYDHQRNKELSVGGYRSFSGFSAGFGVKVKRLQFDYGFGRFHLAGSSHHIGFRLNMDQLFSKL